MWQGTIIAVHLNFLLKGTEQWDFQVKINQAGLQLQLKVLFEKEFYHLFYNTVPWGLGFIMERIISIDLLMYYNEHGLNFMLKA